ncbi:DUF2785 domain-containing protein [Streptomyces sp. WI04-05B]|uniref:DUF2785 domain-containing protein n=1 Tax=Streptomyces TaxID=1883 RepID=UPI0029A7453B|nr:MULTISPECIES: DUF2785 domain-containing protein [unclassified Streptomyces]MDX2544508.1 DUF2785 domain-containing protein [Streptomyces sp. WI04-05B]MDX2587923.1 DUF2785 domain-containing protein [Streptomyces sp. WI04-05A]MDX3751890.1 DUF2785 domain-containing protein [Streptomyces sp. AK08-02]
MDDTLRRHDGDIGELSGAARTAALGALVADLRSPDPVVRDEGAYGAAVRWIPGLDALERRWLGDRTAELFDDPGIQARAFAPLVLARLVDAGVWRQEWWEAFAGWYPGETDLRGYDSELGWVHAAAHGADLLAALARRPEQDPAPLFELVVARLLADTGQVFDAQEDDRIARALAQLLCRPGLAAAGSVGWLDAVSAAFRTGEPGPVPPWASNAMRTLRMLYLLVDRGLLAPGGDGPPSTVTHREAVLDALAATLAIVTPYLPSPSGRDQV